MLAAQLERFGSRVHANAGVRGSSRKEPMSPAELELLLRRILGEGLQLQPIVYLLIVALSLVSGALGAFLGAYLKRRGENLATKADFDSLIDQLRTQTQEVEQIKSEISRAGWLHQRRWDLKRELYWNLLETLEELKQKGRWLHEAVRPYWGPDPEAERLVNGFAKHMQERGTVDKLLALKGVAGIILTEPAVTALEGLSREYNLAVDRILRSERPAEESLRFAQYELAGLLEATETAYSLILSSSQEDLLGSPDAPKG
jgi:hypothetical protein